MTENEYAKEDNYIKEAIISTMRELISVPVRVYPVQNRKLRPINYGNVIIRLVPSANEEEAYT